MSVCVRVRVFMCVCMFMGCADVFVCVCFRSIKENSSLLSSVRGKDERESF